MALGREGRGPARGRGRHRRPLAAGRRVAGDGGPEGGGSKSIRARRSRAGGRRSPAGATRRRPPRDHGGRAAADRRQAPPGPLVRWLSGSRSPAPGPSPPWIWPAPLARWVRAASGRLQPRAAGALVQHGGPRAPVRLAGRVRPPLSPATSSAWWRGLEPVAVLPACEEVFHLAALARDRASPTAFWLRRRRPGGAAPQGTLRRAVPRAGHGCAGDRRGRGPGRPGGLRGRRRRSCPQARVVAVRRPDPGRAPGRRPGRDHTDVRRSPDRPAPHRRRRGQRLGHVPRGAGHAPSPPIAQTGA